jgi:hypothetical protein
VDKKQADLLFKVLKIMNREGVLKHLIVAGSWCLYFYKFYYNKQQPIVSLRTRDVDFVVPKPSSIKKDINLPELLKGLGFVIDHRGEQGYIRLVHPAIFIEFLVPEKGKGIEKAFPLPKLGLNAQALRYLDVLYFKTIILQVRDVEVTLPHPACFLLHKIIVSRRRSNKDKRLKDVEQIERMFDFMKTEKEIRSLREMFTICHPKWQKTIIDNLRFFDKKEIINALL